MNTEPVFSKIAQIRCDMEYGNKNVRDLYSVLTEIVQDLQQYTNLSCIEFMKTINPEESLDQTNAVMEEFYWQTWLIASRLMSVQKMYNHKDYLDLFYNTYWSGGGARFSIKCYGYDLQDFWLRMRKISGLVISELYNVGYERNKDYSEDYNPVAFKHPKAEFKRYQREGIDLVDSEIQELDGYCPFEYYKFLEDFSYNNSDQKLNGIKFKVFYDRISGLYEIFANIIDISRNDPTTETKGQQTIHKVITDEILTDPLIFQKPM